MTASLRFPHSPVFHSLEDIYCSLEIPQIPLNPIHLSISVSPCSECHTTSCTLAPRWGTGGMFFLIFLFLRHVYNLDLWSIGSYVVYIDRITPLVQMAPAALRADWSFAIPLVLFTSASCAVSTASLSIGTVHRIFVLNISARYERASNVLENARGRSVWPARWLSLPFPFPGRP